MQVRMHNPKRVVEVRGPVPVHTLLARLGLKREAVLVVRGEDLVTSDTVLADDDPVEILPVISGGGSAG